MNTVDLISPNWWKGDLYLKHIRHNCSNMGILNRQHCNHFIKSNQFKLQFHIITKCFLQSIEYNRIEHAFLSLKDHDLKGFCSTQQSIEMGACSNHSWTKICINQFLVLNNKLNPINRNQILQSIFGYYNKFLKKLPTEINNKWSTMNIQ